MPWSRAYRHASISVQSEMGKTRVCSSETVAGLAGLLSDATLIGRLLDRSDHRVGSELGDRAVAEVEHLGEVMPGADVHHREGQGSGRRRLHRKAKQHRRVPATGEEQHRPLRLGHRLAEDVIDSASRA